MKSISFILLACMLTSAIAAAGQSTVAASDHAHEKIIRTYFSGWVKKDWNIVSSTLANGFTFTSAAPDDHISLQQFRDKCWPQATHIKRFEFIEILCHKNEAFAIIHVVTMDNHIIRNIEYFRFAEEKIKSIEVFFGGKGEGFPTNAR